ncbi:MAG: hypothetical protein AB7G52_08465 [Arcobacter sp.]
MIGTIPTLTLDGFVNNKNAQMGKLFEYFLASDYSQSNVFYRDISSLKYLITEYKDSQELKRVIENTLSKLYKRHFDNVSVLVEVKESELSSTTELLINITADNDGKQYYLAKDIKQSNGEIDNYESMLDELHEEYNK